MFKRMPAYIHWDRNQPIPPPPREFGARGASLRRRALRYLTDTSILVLSVGVGFWDRGTCLSMCCVMTLLTAADIGVRVHLEAAADVRGQGSQPRLTHGIRGVAGKQASLRCIKLTSAKCEIMLWGFKYLCHDVKTLCRIDCR